MRHEYRPHTEEVKFFRGYASELRESFQNGLLKELAPYPHFVVWRYTLVDQTFKKPLYNPKPYHRDTYYRASVDIPKSWGTLNQALHALASGYFHGIGFVFSKDDPFTGIDLDHCIAQDGTKETWAQEIIESLNTYTEISPSEKGIRMFVEGRTPGGKFGNVEMWSDKHYMTITTRHLDTTPMTIEKRQEALDRLYQQFVPARSQTLVNTRGGDTTLWTPLPGRQEPRKFRQEPGMPEKPDQQVIQEALNEQRSNFSRYWHGDPTLLLPQKAGAKPERNSDSEVFFVLLLMLLSRTGDNNEQVERLYWQSPFAATYPKAAQNIGHDKETGRPVTYLEAAIRRAIEKRNNPPMRR